MHDIIAPYAEKGLIRRFEHPTRDLIGYNYTELCQFSKAWDDVTKMCRGLILNGAGDIVARPLPKFQNYEQHEGPIPSSEPEIYEKLDGSLLICALEDGYAPLFATRGSFTSEQAIRGEQIMFDKYGPPTGWMRSGFTYCFEVIYPENRIVLDYGDRVDVILLAKINTETGEEEDTYFGVPEWQGSRAQRTIPFYPVSVEDLKEQDIVNREGYVLFWREEGLRLKIKFKTYVRLHRLLTGINARHIWECLKSNTGIDEMLEQVPDEFFDWVIKTRRDLLERFFGLEAHAKSEFYSRPPGMDRKAFAEWVRAKETRWVDDGDWSGNETWPPRRHISSILFRMLDGKPYDETIWKMIKPEANQPFRMDEAA